MVDCLSWHSCYGHIRSSKSYSKEKRLTSKKHADQQCSITKQSQNNINTKSSFSCLSGDGHSSKKQLNTNNNNNNNNNTLSSSSSSSSPPSTHQIDEQNPLLQFHMINVTRERNLHLSTNSNDKRLLIFYNISNTLYKIGLRNGDILIFFNELNILKPPVALTIDRVKSEFTSLRRQNKIILIGICRTSNRSLFNNTSIKHLGALTFDEFKSLSHSDELNESPKSLVTIEPKKRVHLFSNKRKSLSLHKRNSASNRDSGFTEIDDPSIISYSNKNQSKTSSEQSEEDDSLATQKSFESSEQSIKKATNLSVEQTNIPSNKPSSLISPYQLLNKYRQNQRSSTTQIITDACFVYRRQIIKKPTSDAMIIRGREIAYQAANSPTMLSSMPNYTHDQVRELYGEVDKKTRRLQENEYISHAPMIDAWNEKTSWTSSSPVKNQLSEECPLPKFQVDQNGSPRLTSSYLSTGLSNPRAVRHTSADSTNDHDHVRGSFRTSIGDRTNISPSPLLLDVHFDFNKVTTSSINVDEQSSVFENTQQKTSNYSNQDSSVQQTETNNTNVSSSIESDPSSAQKTLNERSITSLNNITLTTSKNIFTRMKTNETMEIDSLIDLDDETTVSYNTADESRMETDPDSLFSNKPTQQLKSTSKSMDTDSLTRHSDFLVAIKSPDASFHETSLPSIEKFNQKNSTDNQSKPIQTVHQTTDHLSTKVHQETLPQTESSSTIDINELISESKKKHKISAMDNLIKIIHDINERKSFANDSPVNSNIIQTEKESNTIAEASNELCLITHPYESTEIDNENRTVDQILSTPSQQFDNFESIIDDSQLLIKISPEPEQNFNLLQSNILRMNDLSPIFNNSDELNQNYNSELFIHEQSHSSELTNESEQDFENLYQRYLVNLEQYQSMIEQINEYKQKQKILSPITEESKTLFDGAYNDESMKNDDIEQFCLALAVKRQSNHIGHYGFELEETSDGKILVSSIIDPIYCPNLSIGDELIGINDTFTCTTLQQYYLLFHSLWYNQCEYVQIFVNKSNKNSIISGIIIEVNLLIFILFYFH